MEEWDPRDVSFITPPCSLHSFSLSFSFSAGLFLFFFFFILIRHLSLLSSIHPVVYHPSIAIILLDIFPSSTRLPTTPKNNLSFFFFPPSFFFFFLLLTLSLPSSSLAVVFRFHHLLWRHSSFLLSIFSPLPPSLFLFRSHSFFFLPIFTFCAEKKSLVLFFSLLRLSLMDQRKKVWMEGWRGIMCRDKRRMRRIRKGGIV